MNCTKIILFLHTYLFTTEWASLNYAIPAVLHTLPQLIFFVCYEFDIWKQPIEHNNIFHHNWFQHFLLCIWCAPHVIFPYDHVFLIIISSIWIIRDCNYFTNFYCIITTSDVIELCQIILPQQSTGLVAKLLLICERLDLLCHYFFAFCVCLSIFLIIQVQSLPCTAPPIFLILTRWLLSSNCYQNSLDL